MKGEKQERPFGTKAIEWLSISIRLTHRTPRRKVCELCSDLAPR